MSEPTVQLRYLSVEHEQLLAAWSIKMSEIARAAGVNTVEAFRAFNGAHLGVNVSNIESDSDKMVNQSPR